MALVDIHTIVAVAQFKTLVAVAFIGPYQVYAGAVIADVWMSDTLVYVDATVSSGSEQVADVADALETTLEIFAFTIQTNVWFLNAFVDVHAVHVRGSIFVAFRAFTLKSSRQVYALGITFARIPQTFVVIYALV